MSNTKFQYLYLNSEDREHTHSTNEDATINVNLDGHSFKNIRQVAVKQFSIDNSLFNITRAKGKLSWAEIKLNETPGETDIVKIFTMDLFQLYGAGYYSIKDLFVGDSLRPSMVNYQFTIMNSSVTNEVKTDKRFIQDPDSFKLAFEFTNTSNSTKFFVPILNNNIDDIWLDLGFTKDQVLPSIYINYFSNVEATNMVDSMYNTEPLRGVVLKTNISTYYPLYRQQKNTSIFTRTDFNGRHPINIENVSGVYLTSQALNGGNTYVVSGENGHLQARPKDILEFIQFNGDHYSTISYKPDILHYHYLNGKSVNQIDISITNHAGQIYKANEVGRWNLVLVFEIELEMEVTAQFIKQYNNEGYMRAHTEDKLLLGRVR